MNFEDTLRKLSSWEPDALGLHPEGSNYVFVVWLKPTEAAAAESDRIRAIYKPAQGTRWLHDFPDGTLHRRERAAFLLSRILEWPLIPPTVIRHGPYGEGSWQLYVEHDPDDHYFSLREQHLEDYASVAMFDVLVNNADRKASAVLKDADGKLWAIDNGLSFNYGVRIRTVMHEFSGQSYPPALLSGLSRLAQLKDQDGDSRWNEMAELVGTSGLDGLLKRAAAMLRNGHFPQFSIERNVPYPML